MGYDGQVLISASVRIGVRDQIDEARGATSRSAWLKEAIEEKLQRAAPECAVSGFESRPHIAARVTEQTTITPHDWVPDTSQFAGDCAICGHVRTASFHIQEANDEIRGDRHGE